MPNIASALREEILRLSRKENRNQNAVTKKAAGQHRRDIAALKRHVAQLQRVVSQLVRRAMSAPASSANATLGPQAQLRFVAKGLRSHRVRLGLSATEFGKLAGASANSVYAWETGKTTPRRDQVVKIAAVRKMGKREALQRLKVTK